MKKQLLLFMMMLLPLMVNADVIEVEGIWYNLILERKIAEVTRMPSGGYSDTITIIRGNNIETIITSGGSYSGTIEIPSKITHEGEEYAVTNIGDDAFNCSSKLTSITIPNSITSIGNRAFRYCDRLPSITIPNSVTTIGNEAFENCRSLTSIKIPNSVTSIGSYAFDNCCSLASITIPDGVATIEMCTFSGCSDLTSVIIPENVTSIGLRAFSGCGITSIHLPSTITSIGDDAFDCDKLVRVVSDMVVPPASSNPFNSYTYNEGYLIVPKDSKFEYETTNGWKQFVSIYEAGSEEKTDFTITVEQEGTLSDAVENLEASLVENLTIKGRLNGKDIAFLVSKKGKVAHLNSLNLKDVTLVSDNTMYNSIFYGVNEGGASTETTYYYLSDENYKKEEISYNGLGGYKTTIHYYNNYLAGAFHGMNLKKIIMPASITQIGERTFQNNTILEEVWFPESVTSIGGGHPGRNEYAGAFYKCSNLTTIPSLAHIENIEEAAFAYCTNITGEIDLSSAKTVKENAFYACSGISYVKFSSKLGSVDGEAFAGCSSLSDVSFDENSNVLFSRTSFSSTPWSKKLPTENGIVYMGKVAMAVENGTKPQELTFREGTVSIAHDFLDGATYEKIRTVNLPNSVKRIGNKAFYVNEYSSYYGSNIEFINFPEGLIEIGSEAFCYNKRIQKLALPNSIKYVGASAFASMEKLESVENYNVPQSDHSTFYHCDLLESVKIGSNVETISKGMFANCEKLANVAFEERNNSLSLSIEEGAFSSCENITEIILPEGVDSIGKEAFRDCSGLTNIKIPSTLKSIEKSAFSGCNNPQKIIIEDIAAWCNNTFHESLSFEKYLYMNDEEIKELVIPNTATSIADEAFYKCTGLTSVIIPNSVNTIGRSAFSNCSGVTSVTIDNGVTSIGDYAFYSCEGLTSVTIPNSVTSIGSSAFSYCSSLGTITIGNGVTSIGDEAFYYCTALATVTLGSGLTNIGESAFFYCRGLKDVYCYAENVPQTKSSTFDSSNYNSATLHVPLVSIDAYKSRYPWYGFKNIVKIAMPEHTLTYMVDGEFYKTYSIEEGETITPESEPTKEGYTFSGWSEIPETMPDHDVTITGTFSINKYILEYKVDGEVYKTDSLEYGTNITPEAEPTKEGYTFSGWSDIPETMPANDVTITGSFTQIDFEVGNATYEVSGDEVSVIEGNNYSGDAEISSTVVINDQTYTVTSIADGAFQNNTNITSVTIPETVTSIGANAFDGCNKLASIIIGKAVSTIGSKAFANLTSTAQTRGENDLKVSCYAETLPITASDAFENTSISNATLLVYDNSVALYKASAPWNGFGAIMGFDEAAGIDGVMLDNNGKAKIFSVEGKLLNKLQKGLNIIQMSDGKTRKIFVK